VVRAAAGGFFAHASVYQDTASGGLWQVLALLMRAEVPFGGHLQRLLARHQHAIAYAMVEVGLHEEEHVWAAAMQRIALRDDRFQHGTLAASLLAGLRGHPGGLDPDMARQAHRLWLERAGMQCQVESGHPSVGHSAPLQDPALGEVGGSTASGGAAQPWVLEGVAFPPWKPRPSQPGQRLSLDLLVAAEMRDGKLGSRCNADAQSMLRMMQQADEHLSEPTHFVQARAMALAAALEPAQLVRCHQALQNAGAVAHASQP
jgi:hypothetical protein